MTDDRVRSYGILLLRVALGAMFLAHSIVYMLMTLTLDGTAKFFVSIGLPAWLAYATFVAEAVGGVLLILGIRTRWVALALSPILIGATWGRHSGSQRLWPAALVEAGRVATADGARRVTRHGTGQLNRGGTRFLHGSASPATTRLAPGLAEGGRKDGLH